MSWVFGALAITLGLILLWGVVSPRSQWRATMSWSASDPYRSEPGGAAYGVRRLISGLGVLVLLGIGAVTSFSAVANQPSPSAAPSVVEQLWGAPEPRLINRMVTPSGAAPAGLVEVPVLAYEDVGDDLPDYYARLKEFLYLGADDIPGYVGRLPDVGNGAFDFADLVINVRGPVLCIPRSVVMLETADTVQVAVYYGLPDPADGSVPDNVVGCPTESGVTGSVLIPLALAAELGDRTVESLDGTPIREVFSPTE